MQASNYSLLVVENDELVLESIKARLRFKGFQVFSAINARQALAIWQSVPIDVLISDINMPGLDGIGLAEDIRRTSEVPIYLITAYPSDYEDSYAHLSNVRFLSKPFDWNDLLRRIEADLVAGVH